MRYAAAVDESNLDIAFLVFWGILEKITDTVGRDYNATIQRAAWIFDEPLLATEMLRALRSWRNRYVHSAATRGDNDQAAQLAKWFVDRHLMHLMRNRLGATSIEDYAKYLASSTCVADLEKQRGRLKRAIRFRSKRKVDAT